MFEQGKNLKFFNKKGDQLNAKRIQGVWYGAIFFDKTSSNIHQVENIYILEEFMDDTNDLNLDYCYPRSSVANSKLKVYWQNKEQNKDNIFLYTIDYNSDKDYPVIVKNEEILYDIDDGLNDIISGYNFSEDITTENATLLRIMGKNITKSKALKINIALYSKEENTYNRLLQLYLNAGDKTYKIAEFLIYGDVEGEDERYKTILENVGMDINPSLSPVFRDSDVYEEEIDWSIINDKRKELIIAGNEIFPYQGSYKGFINALKFFGYSDLKLREYWENIDITSEYYKTVKLVDVPLDLKGLKVMDFEPNRVWKKTSKFSLIYELNKESGEYDDEGFPILEDVKIFSEDEILIKLFSLKKVLKDLFLPLNARIVDITGEGLVYEKYNIKTTSAQLENLSVDQNYEIDFDVNPKLIYLEDINNYKTKSYNEYKNPKIKEMVKYNYYQLRDFKIGDIIDGRVGFDLDVKNTNIGSKITLNIKNSPIVINAMNVSFNYLNDEIFTFDDIDKLDIYEIEWRITNETYNTLVYRKRGLFDELKIHDVYIKTDGIYSVELISYNTTNNINAISKKNIFEVVNKKSDIVGFYHYTNNKKNIFEVENFEIDSTNMSLYNNTINLNTKILDCNNLTFDNLNVYDYMYENYLDYIIAVKVENVDYNKNKIKILGDYTSNDNPIKQGNSIILYSETLEREEIIKDIDNNQIKIPTTTLLTNKFVTVESYAEISNCDVLSSLWYNKEYYYISGQHYEIAQLRIDGVDLTKLLKVGDIINIKYQYEGSEFEQYKIARLDYADMGTIDGSFTLLGYHSVDPLAYKYPGYSMTNAQFYEIWNPSVSKAVLKYKTISVSTIVEQQIINNGINTIDIKDNILYNELKNKYLEYGNQSDFVLKWDGRYQEYIFNVVSLEFDGIYTVIEVDNYNKKLKYIDNSYHLKYYNFDYDYALSRLGINNVKKIKSLENLNINDLNNRSIVSFDVHPDYNCGFVIKKVVPSGKIQINESEIFEFPNNPNMTMTDAVNALNNTNIPEFKKYNYSIALAQDKIPYKRVPSNGIQGFQGLQGFQSIKYDVGIQSWDNIGFQNKINDRLLYNAGIQGNQCLIPENDVYYDVHTEPNYIIWASSKISGLYGLSYIRYYDGVIGNNEITTNADSSYPLHFIKKIKDTTKTSELPTENILYSCYKENGMIYPSKEIDDIYYCNDKFWESYKIPYSYAINGTFTFDNTVIKSGFIDAPLMSTVFFCIPNKISGIDKIYWELILDSTGTVLVKTKSKNFVWTFDRIGNYSLSCTMYNKNNNKITLNKKSNIKIY